jgi:hypothetical protein
MKEKRMSDEKASELMTEMCKIYYEQHAEDDD